MVSALVSPEAGARLVASRRVPRGEGPTSAAGPVRIPRLPPPQQPPGRRAGAGVLPRGLAGVRPVVAERGIDLIGLMQQCTKPLRTRAAAAARPLYHFRQW